MGAENAGNNFEQPPLTPEQEVAADQLLEFLGLEDVHDKPLEMYGAKGDVRYGLGRCAHHIMESKRSPDEWYYDVMGQLEAQGSLDEPPAEP